jgi:hypothetical protein
MKTIICDYNSLSIVYFLKNRIFCFFFKTLLKSITIYSIIDAFSSLYFIYLITGDDVYYILIGGVSGVKDKGKGVYEQ